MLFERSVENLNGPILAPSAIADASPAYALAGQTLRSKVCHFVRTRLLSTFHFLSIRTSVSDASLLLTRCFERMAALTEKHEQWIEPVYRTFDTQLAAEEAYQNDVFYYVLNQLPSDKAVINQLNLQSQIQINLQQFTDQLPMVVQFRHFQTELHRPRHRSSASLRLLRHILESFEILSVTHLIYDLGRLYVLLHQTYTQLIESKEFVGITLRELFERAEKHSDHLGELRNQNRKERHQTIIDDGIKAVNDYHRFSGGLIQPGACHETQRFTTITFDTPVHYLVTTENPDEGDIIMRILR